MRVLIVGASGFVGRHLLAECLRRGDDPSATYRPGESPPPGGDVRWLACELLEDGSLEAALAAARPEGIVHLAGQADVGRSHRDPVGTYRANAEGTVRLLAAVRAAAPDARVCAVTSAELYGAPPPEDLPVRETCVPNPRTPYGLSKAAADDAAAFAARAWGLAVIRLRPFNHVGPGQRRGFVVPDFAAQVAAIERGEVEPVLRVGNLSPRRDFTDVRDMVRGYRDALERAPAGEAYNLCSGRSVSIGEIAQWMARRAKRPVEIVSETARQREGDVDEIRGDPARAREAFGFAPRIALETSLGDVLDEWRAGGPS